MLTMCKTGLVNSRRMFHRQIAVVASLLFAASNASYASLPTVAPPPNVQATSTNWLDWVRNGFDEALTIIGLAVATIGMIMVVWKCLKAYQEVGQGGRGDWGDVATAATGGALVMMLGAGVLTIAAAVF